MEPVDDGLCVLCTSLSGFPRTLEDCASVLADVLTKCSGGRVLMYSSILDGNNKLASLDLVCWRNEYICRVSDANHYFLKRACSCTM